MVNLQTKTVQSTLFDQTLKTKTAGSSEADFISAYKSYDEAQAHTKTKRETAREQADKDVKDFFDKVKQEGGAASYIVKLNLEKIEELVKKREEELKDSYGVNAKPPLNPEQMKNAMSAVKEGVAQYKQELLKNLEDKTKDESLSKIRLQNSKLLQNPLAELLKQIA